MKGFFILTRLNRKFFILILGIIFLILSHIIIRCKKEWLFISCGIIVLILFYSNIITSSNWLFPCAILGGWYAFEFIYHVFLNRVRFDQILVSGNFLTRVILLVLFVPFSLAALGNLFFESPKELTYYEEKTKSPSHICSKSETDEGDRLGQDPPSMLWSTIFHLMDPGNQDMATGKGRLWTAIIAISGMILLNGLLVSSLIGYFDKRKDLWMKGGTRYGDFLYYHPHYVVIGGNDMAAGIVKQLLKDKGETTSSNNKTTITEIIREFFYRKKPFILIQTSQDVEKFRRELFSTLTEEEKKRIIIYYGSRISPEDIEELKLESAKEVYILGEETRTDDIESYHDTINMECMELILDVLKKTKRGEKLTTLLTETESLKKEIEEEKEGTKKKTLKETLENNKNKIEILKLECRIMFEYQTTFSVFQFYDIKNTTSSYINFKPFNYYEMWAQKVLINKEINEQKIKENASNGGYLPLEGADGIKKGSDDYVHLFIVGMSRMGIAMAVEAAHLAHYPNYVTKNIRTKITFIDKNAAEEKEFFMGRLKSLFDLSHWRYGKVDGRSKLVWEEKHEPAGYEYLGGDFLDIEWEFVNGGIEVPAVQDYIQYSATPQAKITIAICLPESSRAHAAAMYLSRGIYESTAVLQILVYNRYGNAIIDAIIKSGNIHPYCGKFKSFGHAAGCFVEQNIIDSENIGKEINAAYEKINIRDEDKQH